MMTGVRIVQIVETLALGGLEMMALNLAIAQRRAGHKPAIYTIFSPGALAPQAEAEGIPVIAFEKPKGFAPDTIWAMARRLRDDRVEVVHTHNSIIHHYGALAGRLAGAPATVSTRHGMAFHSGRRPEMYYRAMMPLTDAVVFVCEAGRRHFTASGAVPVRKSTVILNGIPLEPFQARSAHPGANAPRIRFGTIGRMVKAKAHHDLLEAFSRIAGELPASELHIWGDGELRPVLEQRAAAAGLEKRVFLHGATANAAEALSTLDIFVLSSISEGLPLVILEAMAAGLPIVSTSVGGVEEAAPEGSVAWYAPPGAPAELAAAMRLAASADLAAVGRAAYSRAAGYFGIDAMQRGYEKLFLRLLGRSVC